MYIDRNGAEKKNVNKLIHIYYFISNYISYVIHHIHVSVRVCAILLINSIISLCSHDPLKRWWWRIRSCFNIYTYIYFVFVGMKMASIPLQTIFSTVQQQRQQLFHHTYPCHNKRAWILLYIKYILLESKNRILSWSVPFTIKKKCDRKKWMTMWIARHRINHHRHPDPIASFVIFPGYFVWMNMNQQQQFHS